MLLHAFSGVNSNSHDITKHVDMMTLQRSLSFEYEVPVMLHVCHRPPMRTGEAKPGQGAPAGGGEDS